jgi:hypothetical protein
MSNTTVNPTVAERFIETRYGIAHVTLTKLPAAQGGSFVSEASVEGNIGTAGPVIWCQNSILDYAVDMYEEIADNTARLEHFLIMEVIGATS